MIHVACCLWDANDLSVHFSRDYDASWVEKLYRGFKRNLTVPFRFICYTDWARNFREPIGEVVNGTLGQNGYGDMIRPFELNEPMILVGLDTVITGNIDHMAEWCLSARQIAMPIHPREPHHACNGVVLVGKGNRRIFDEWKGENDMVWLRRWPHQFIDQLWPGHVESYKAHVRGRGLTAETKVVYCHGNPKPPAIREKWIEEHWR